MWATYTDMVVEVITNGKINPLIGCYHGRSVDSGILDDFQLVRWAYTTCKALATHTCLAFGFEDSLRKSTLADPKVPADKITRPVPGVTFTVPE